jgi:hypothetical protein
MNATRKRLVWIGLGLALIAAGVLVQAKGGWRFLGDRVVNDRVDHDVVAVGAHHGTFQAIKLVVKGAPVHFIDVKVHFANGGVQDVSLRTVVPAGGESRVIGLEGGDRVIDRVEFWYETQTLARGKKAVVRVFGRT